MKEDLTAALQVLQRGGIILYPTDTVWGIGCDATNAEAVNMIYEIKQREDSKSMIILLDSVSRLQQYVDVIPDIAWDLVELADKPLTVIYPGAKNLAPNLPADDHSIGIRIVRDEFCKKLIERFRKPLVSTSANISGQPAPAIFSEIPHRIINAVDYVVAWRQGDSTRSNPSGIIKIGPKGEIEIIRE